MAKRKALKITKIKKAKVSKFKTTKFPKISIKLKTSKAARKYIKTGGKTYSSSSTKTGIAPRSRLSKIPSTSKYANINPTKVSY